MTEQAKKYLFDIITAIELIEEFLGDLNFFQYESDNKTKSAVERQLGIIGEAVNKFDKLQTGYILANSKEIISLRNRIIHSYDNIDDTIIWAIKVNHLPLLKTETENLLNNNIA